MPQPIPSPIDLLTAAVLLALGIVFFPLCWGGAKVLKFSIARNLPKDDMTWSRVYISLALINLLLVAHALNCGLFLISVSGWPQMGSWYRLLLPEKTNNLILLLSYFGLISVWKHAWRDLKLASDLLLGGEAGVSSHA